MPATSTLPFAAVLAGVLSGPLLGGMVLPPALADAKPEGRLSTTPSLGAAMQASTTEQLELVAHLRRIGALFYGAWWCPACFQQKNLFGQEAGNQLPYVECEKTDAQRKRCEEVGIGAYPTWILGNRRLEGVQTLRQLGEWSGYGGRPSP